VRVPGAKGERGQAAASRKEEKTERERERDAEEPEAERKGVTTAALSITIFTTRRNFRET